MEIYFDTTLISEEYYMKLYNSYKLFTDNFALGSVASSSYEIEIDKNGVSSQPSEVTLKESGTPFAILYPDSIEENDYSYVYSLTDAMTRLNFNYDASDIIVASPTQSVTLLELVQDICSEASITLGTLDFNGYDKDINWYDNSKTARDYISYVAELNSGYAQIVNNVLYFRKQNTSSVKTINIEDCSDFKISGYHKISRVVYELGTLKYEYGDETYDTLYLNSDNVYITEETDVENIYDELNGFEFYSFTASNCPIDYDVKAGSIITFTDGTNSYPTIAGYELNYFGGWYGGYSLDVSTVEEEETQYSGTTQKLKAIEIEVNRNNNTITQRIDETNDTVEGINNVIYGDPDDEEDVGILGSMETVKETLSTLNTTIFEQSSTAFQMYFAQTGLQETVDSIQDIVDTNTDDLSTLSQYIRFEAGTMILGRNDSQATLVVTNDRISFMNGDNESAYITGNQLYITDSTILNKLQVGSWETKPDSDGNLNTRYVGGD